MDYDDASDVGSDAGPNGKSSSQPWMPLLADPNVDTVAIEGRQDAVGLPWLLILAEFLRSVSIGCVPLWSDANMFAQLDSNLMPACGWLIPPMYRIVCIGIFLLEFPRLVVDIEHENLKGLQVAFAAARALCWCFAIGMCGTALDCIPAIRAGTLNKSWWKLTLDFTATTLVASTVIYLRRAFYDDFVDMMVTWPFTQHSLFI